jgi:hypothetical protein
MRPIGLLVAKYINNNGLAIGDASNKVTADAFASIANLRELWRKVMPDRSSFVSGWLTMDWHLRHHLLTSARSIREFSSQS